MSISDVTLTASARSNLLSLQQTSDLLATTQLRLATGQRVNSAVDNATAFFQSQGFLNRASDLSRLKDGLSNALQTVRAASNAIDSITKVVQQAQGLVTSARQTTSSSELTNLATQFNGLLTQINALVNDAVFNGVNLLAGGSTVLRVQFNENDTSFLTIQADNLTATAGLGIDLIANAFNAADITAADADLTSALTELRAAASTFGTNSTIIETRQSFTTTLISTLQTASDNLVLADVNEEGANLQALQARQQLGIVSLGISGQEAQAILRLF